MREIRPFLYFQTSPKPKISPAFAPAQEPPSAVGLCTPIYALSAAFGGCAPKRSLRLAVRGQSKAAGSRGRAPAARQEIFLRELPVYQSPPAVQIGFPPVLVVQIIGVFPDVDTEDRPQPAGEGRLLIGGGKDADSPIRTGGKPGPARSELAEGGLGKDIAEPLKRPITPVDCLRQTPDRAG